MRLLVIGNGFDIAHGLRTKYSDFLDICLNKQEYLSQYESDGKFINFVTKLHSKYKDLRLRMESNCWVNYFEERRSYLGENWIDFEKEIKDVCEVAATVSDQDYDRLSFVYRVFFNGYACFDLKYMRKGLLDLIDLLNLFLLEVTKTRLGKYYKQVVEFAPTAVINFNYTSTFLNQYTKTIPLDFIHGKINEDKNSIVLGFNTLGSTEKDIEFAEFIKYFQMVNNDIALNILHQKSQKTNKKESLTIEETMFFGHSMDKTDGDMIMEIIDKSKSVKLLYHSKEHKAQMIKNLIDIFEERKFRELCLSEQSKISFVEQAASAPLSLKTRKKISTFFDILAKRIDDSIRVQEFYKQHNYRNFSLSPYVWEYVVYTFNELVCKRTTLNLTAQKEIAEDMLNYIEVSLKDPTKMYELIAELRRVISKCDDFQRKQEELLEIYNQVREGVK